MAALSTPNRSKTTTRFFECLKCAVICEGSSSSRKPVCREQPNSMPPSKCCFSAFKMFFRGTQMARSARWYQGFLSAFGSRFILGLRCTSNLKSSINSNSLTAQIPGAPGSWCWVKILTFSPPGCSGFEDRIGLPVAGKHPDKMLSKVRSSIKFLMPLLSCSSDISSAWSANLSSSEYKEASRAMLSSASSISLLSFTLRMMSSMLRERSLEGPSRLCRELASACGLPTGYAKTSTVSMSGIPNTWIFLSLAARAMGSGPLMERHMKAKYSRNRFCDALSNVWMLPPLLSSGLMRTTSNCIVTDSASVLWPRKSSSAAMSKQARPCAFFECTMMMLEGFAFKYASSVRHKASNECKVGTPLAGIGNAR
mmetsp:Transcript_64974/g.188388  ORF Transcript_64974/g.188388 Transcript_64974/m.188388 type:complete len:368 (-) Transcript_64974:907-2010(-)